MKKLFTVLLIALTFIGCQKDEVGTPNQNNNNPPIDTIYHIEDDCNCGVVTSVEFQTTSFNANTTIIYRTVKIFVIRNYCSGNTGTFYSNPKNVASYDVFNYMDSERAKYLNKPLCVDDWIINWGSSQNQSTYTW